MAKKVGLMTIHGIGEYSANYHEKLTAALQKRLAGKWDAVSFQPVNYAEIYQGNEDKYWSAIKDTMSAWNEVRKFFLFKFADATSFEHAGHRNTAEYQKTMSEVKRAIRGILSDAESPAGIPIVLVAHSLGCQVITNYLWDQQKGLTDPAKLDAFDSFLSLSTLTDFITIGCNIPLFIGGLNKVESFRAPNSTFEWTNYYDVDDILGWPLEKLSVLDTKFPKVKDVQLNSGNLLTGWNPAVHDSYWEDPAVVEKVAQALLKAIG